MNILPNQFLTAMDCLPHGLDLVVFQRTNEQGKAVCDASFENGVCTRAMYANENDSSAFMLECEQALKLRAA